MKLVALALLTCPALLHAEPMKPEFHYTILIGKPAKEVWGALTEKEAVDRYYMVPLHTLELKFGGKISYGREAEMITGFIIAIKAPKTLVHTFRFAGSEDPETCVSYSITAIWFDLSVGKLRDFRMGSAHRDGDRDRETK